jgi:hypothetical protein
MFLNTLNPDRRNLHPYWAILLLPMVITATAAKAEELCRFSTRTANNEYGYEEVNTCPFSGGTFSNDNWRISVGPYEPGAYYYSSTNLHDDSFIDLIDFNVQGTIDRPQYRFHNGDYVYSVTFRYSDPNTIRLQVYQNNREILNQLLYR